MQKATKEFEAEHGSIGNENNRKIWEDRQKELKGLMGGQTPPGHGPTDMTDEEEGDGKGARQVIEWLETKAYGDKPFFIGWGVARPHIPLWAPQKYFDMYPPGRLPMDPQPADDWNDIPEIALNLRYKLYGDPANNEPIRREVTAAYYACITFIDAQVGMLLGALNRLGLADNTIIVFTSDHGYLLGEHHLWEKGMLFEEVARVPLIVRMPGRIRPGSVCPRLVELVDLYPTLAELARITPGDRLEGTSFVPLLSDPQQAWKRGAFTVVQRPKEVLARSVRSERYRYTEWGSPEVSELYDLVDDPHSFTNLAKAPGHARELREMRLVVERRMEGGGAETVSTCFRVRFARRHLATVGLAAWLGGAIVVLGEETLAGRTNVIVILSDDQGYADLSCAGGHTPTPSLDRLAAEGVRFAQCYTASPVCSPTRAALPTGNYQQRISRDFDWVVGGVGSSNGLPPSTPTLSRTC